MSRDSFERQVRELEIQWLTDGRWEGVERGYSAADVVRLRGSVRMEPTLARRGAETLWRRLHQDTPVRTFGALTGAQAVQMVRGGLEAIYLSGWQVAGDNNLSGQTYPDQSLYPSNSVPAVVRRLNNALLRADQVEWCEGDGETGRDWLVPIVADAEAGFGGPLHGFELTKAMIEAGAAGVHFEDQLASEKKCGHLGGKVLVPTSRSCARWWRRGWRPTCWTCPRCSWRAPTPTAPRCSPATWTSATAPSAPASAPPRGTSA